MARIRTPPLPLPPLLLRPWSNVSLLAVAIDAAGDAAAAAFDVVPQPPLGDTRPTRLLQATGLSLLDAGDAQVRVIAKESGSSYVYCPRLAAAMTALRPAPVSQLPRQTALAQLLRLQTETGENLATGTRPILDPSSLRSAPRQTRPCPLGKNKG